MVWALSLSTTNLLTRSLSPGLLAVRVFGVCHGLVGRYAPLAITVLYPRRCVYEALPQ